MESSKTKASPKKCRYPKKRKGRLGRFAELWRNPDTYIFNSALDAILAMVVLVAIPLVSLYFVYAGGGAILSNYGFPFISIVCAALYDTYGRYVLIKATDSICAVVKVKLFIRAGFDIVSVLIACLVCGTNTSEIIWFLPGILLLIPGILLIGEVVRRIKISFLLLFGGC